MDLVKYANIDSFFEESFIDLMFESPNMIPYVQPLVDYKWALDDIYWLYESLSGNKLRYKIYL